MTRAASTSQKRSLLLASFRVANEDAKDEQVPEAGAKLLRQTVVEYRVDAAVHVEEYATHHDDVVEYAVADQRVQSIEDEYEAEHFDRIDAHVEDNDHAHEHEDQLPPRLHDLLQVVARGRRVDARPIGARIHVGPTCRHQVVGGVV